MRLSRRAIMKALGVSTLAPLLLSGSRARAGGSTIPKRIVFVHIYSGSMPGRWEPTGPGGAGTPTETSWDVNMDLHGALAPYRNDLCYFENLDFVSELDDPVEPASAHIQGGTHAMTAAHRSSAASAGGPSIDQVIAAGINTPSPVTLIPSLEISWAPTNESVVSAGPSGARLPRLTDPVRVYDRLFPSGGGGSSGDDIREAERRTRVFELVRGRYADLAPRLGGVERQRIEQQLQTVSDLERRLALASMRTAEPPPRTILDPLRGMRADSNLYYETALDIDVRLVAAALHADVTRVVTLEIADAPDDEIGYTPGQFGTGTAHDLIHRVMETSGADPLTRDPTAVEIIRRQHLRGMDWVRLLLDELAGRTETDGSRLLDNTVVVYTSQIADGSHCLQGMPWFTVGSCGGALRTGRFFRSGRDRSRTARRWITPRWTGAGRSHSDLFVSLAQAMEVPIDSFGHPAACTGPIPGWNI